MIIVPNVPIRIQTELHDCHGIYCEDCLLRHLKDNNTCPIHEDAVLFELPRQPEFVSGERRAADTLDQVTDSVEAFKFVDKLWNVTEHLYDNEQIFDSDIREKINETLMFIGECYNHKYGLLIKDEHLAGVMDVAREMVKMHFKYRGTAPVHYEDDLSILWSAAIGDAVGWKISTTYGGW